MVMSDEEILRMELLEHKFIIIKIVIGMIVGTIFGLLQLRGILYILIAIGILFVYIFLARELLPKLKEVNILKLILWDGTFSYIIAVLLLWVIVYNLINPLRPLP